MPINYADYNPDFKELSKELKIKAGWRCQICQAEHLKPHHQTGKKVILTTMHLDQNKKNDSLDNLKVACLRCHSRYDVKFRVYNRNNLLRRAGQTVLNFT